MNSQKQKAQQKAQEQNARLFVHTQQDTTVTFNSKKDKQSVVDRKESQKHVSQRQIDPLHIADSDEKGGILETNKPNLDFQQSLMKARTAKGFSQKQLAQQLQIQVNVLQSYENGKDVPNNQIIAKIERALGAKLPRNTKQNIKK